MTAQESVELFTLFNLRAGDGVTPRVTSAVGPRLAAFGSPEAFAGAGAVAIYAYYDDRQAWGYVGVLQGNHTGNSSAVRSLGSSLVIAGDILIVGAAGDDQTPGRVVIARPPYGVWSYGSLPSLSFLSAPKAAKNDRFGAAVDCCFDGQEWYVAVGATHVEPKVGPYGTGALYVYRGLETSDEPWSGNWGANPVEGAPAESRFASTVAIGNGLDADGQPDGTVVVAVGAPGAVDGQGAVYVGHTTKPGEWPGRWTFSQVLQPQFPDFVPEDFVTSDFGSSVAIGVHGLLAVGAPSDPNFEKEVEGTGAVWLYRRGADGFEVLQEGGSLYGSDEGARFGASIAFPAAVPEGDLTPAAACLVAAAPGTRFVGLYSTEDGLAYTETATFSPFAGKDGDGFGQSVGIAVAAGEPWVVAGAPGDLKAGIQSGGYLFAGDRRDMSWLAAPKVAAEPLMRWMNSGLEHYANLTPEPYDYFR